VNFSWDLCVNHKGAKKIVIKKYEATFLDLQDSFDAMSYQIGIEHPLHDKR